MRRIDLIRRIQREARSQGKSFTLLRNVGDHEVWVLDGQQVPIPRHREINELTAQGILRDAGGAAREGLVAMMDRMTYDVKASRSGDWWAIDVPALLGAHTQARRLDRVEHMAREVISLLVDVPEDSFDVRIQAELDDEWARLLRETREARIAADEASERAQRLVRTAIVTLQGAGLTTREVGQLLGVTHQRVQQLAADASRAGANTAKR